MKTRIITMKENMNLLTRQNNPNFNSCEKKSRRDEYY